MQARQRVAGSRTTVLVLGAEERPTEALGTELARHVGSRRMEKKTCLSISRRPF